MAEIRYSDSHLYTIAVQGGGLQVIPEELDRVKKSASYRIMCILDGECRLFLSGASYHLQKNDLCFFCPGDIYRTIPIRYMNVLNIYFTFDRGDVAKLANIVSIDQSSVVMRHNITDAPLLNRPFVLKNYTEGSNIVSEMPSGSSTCPALVRKQQDTLLELLIMRMLSHKERLESNRHQDKRFSLMTAITQYIRANIHEKISCRSIAEYFSYHPNYLNEIVSSQTGMTLHRFILEERIKSITDELIDTDKPISQIAQDYAFFDSSHLDRCYTDVTGLRPSEVRKAARS